MKSERGQPIFPYHYGFEADTYTFYRVPKVLFSEQEFSGLSTDARLLYGLLLDRMQLSVRNNWMDEDGRVYIYFTVDNIMECLACGNKKAGSLLAELDDKKGIGLITRVRQGMGRPDRIYVHKCISEDMPKRHVKKCPNDMSRDFENTCHDVSKRHPNNTENNKTDQKEIYPIESDQGSAEDDDVSTVDLPEVSMDEMGWKEYLEYFEKALSMDALRADLPMKQGQLEEIKDLLAEVCSTKRSTVRIAGDERPASEVRARLMSLNDGHIRYVLESLDETTTRVRNIRQYLLAALYNAPLTINSYYDALVRHDLYGK